MKRKLQALFILLLIALLVACSDTPETEVDSEIINTTGTIADVSGIDNFESQLDSVLVLHDSASFSDIEETAIVSDDLDNTARPDGWSEETHSNSADPNYDVVFPDDEVNNITITIDPDNWQAMLDDMTATFGEPGSGGGLGARPQGVAPDPGLGGPDGGDLGGAPGGKPPAPGLDGPVDGDFTTENPIWVAATIEFEGDVWTDVGVRFKGNSSLRGT